MRGSYTTHESVGEKIIVRRIQTGYSLVLKWRNGTLKLNVLKGLFMARITVERGNTWKVWKR